MRRPRRSVLAALASAALLLMLLPLSACVARSRSSPDVPRASASVHDAAGGLLGTVRVERTDMGVRIRGSLRGLAPGTHGIHLHQTGACLPPGFTTAGAHLNPGGRKHGLESPDGAHAGDLPNLEVSADGTAELDLVVSRVTLADSASPDLLDADGTALVIHAERDDQRTDPSGNSGARVACGSLTRGT